MHTSIITIALQVCSDGARVLTEGVERLGAPLEISGREIRTRGVTDPRPRGGTARIGDLGSHGL